MLLGNFTEIKQVSLFVFWRGGGGGGGGLGVEDWNSLTKYKSMHDAPDI